MNRVFSGESRKVKSSQLALPASISGNKANRHLPLGPDRYTLKADDIGRQLTLTSQLHAGSLLVVSA